MFICRSRLTNLNSVLGSFQLTAPLQCLSDWVWMNEFKCGGRKEFLCAQKSLVVEWEGEGDDSKSRYVLLKSIINRNFRIESLWSISFWDDGRQFFRFCITKPIKYLLECTRIREQIFMKHWPAIDPCSVLLPLISNSSAAHGAFHCHQFVHRLAWQGCTFMFQSVREIQGLMVLNHWTGLVALWLPLKSESHFCPSVSEGPLTDRKAPRYAAIVTASPELLGMLIECRKWPDKRGRRMVPSQ
jgi:hypothetical protein